MCSIVHETILQAKNINFKGRVFIACDPSPWHNMIQKTMVDIFV